MTSTCGNAPASRSRGGRRRDCEDMQSQRYTYAKIHAPGDTGKDPNHAGTSVGGQAPPCLLDTPRKPKDTSVLSSKQLHPQRRQGQDSKPSQIHKLSFSGPRRAAPHPQAPRSKGGLRGLRAHLPSQLSVSTFSCFSKRKLPPLLALRFHQTWHLKSLFCF